MLVLQLHLEKKSLYIKELGVKWCDIWDSCRNAPGENGQDRENKIAHFRNGVVGSYLFLKLGGQK